MLRVLVIEDEAPALRRICQLLREVAPECAVAGTADSVSAARAWLGEHGAPDLVLADIELGDGLSLELFRERAPGCPVIFATAHDEYLLAAFATHGIAYLLKPVKREELAAALQKYRELGRHFAGNLAALAAQVAAAPHVRPSVSTLRRRVLAQKGVAFQPIEVEEVAYFFSADKLTFLVTRGGERCLVNESLGVLEPELDATRFRRVNRNFLVHISAVRSFRSVGKGRLTVQLHPAPVEEVLVSQERAAEFRAWAGR